MTPADADHNPNTLARRLLESHLSKGRFTLADFLDVALAAQDGDSEQWLRDVWAQHAEAFTDINVSAFLEWLALHVPRDSAEKESRQLTTESHAEEPQFAALREFAAEAGRQDKAFLDWLTARRRSHTRDYGYFVGAYQFAPLLEEFFIDANDPAVVISTHLQFWIGDDHASPAPENATRIARNDLKTSTHTPLEALHLAIDQAPHAEITPSTCRFLADTVLPWLGATLLIGLQDKLKGAHNLTGNVKRQVTLACWLGEGRIVSLLHNGILAEEGERVELSLIAEALPLLPQTFFERYLEALLDVLYEEYPQAVGSGLLGGVDLFREVLMGLPIETDECDADCLDAAVIPRRRPHAQTVRLHDGAGTLRALLEFKRTSSPMRLPYVPTRLYSSVVDTLANINDNWRSSTGLAATVADRLRQLWRCRADAGRRVPDHILANRWDELLSDVDRMRHLPPLFIRLAPTDFPFQTWEHCRYERWVFADGIGVPVQGHPEPVWQRHRMDSAMSMTRQALHEGYVELANAILAFAVFTQTVFDPADLRCDWGELTALRRELADSHGAAMVDRALDIALNSAKDLCPGSEQERLLRGLARGTHSQLIGTRAHSFDELWAELTRLFGDDWTYLPEWIRFRLHDAELLWSVQSPLVGTGRGDFGGVLSNYARIVEVTLKDIVSPVFVSDAYREHCERKNKKAEEPTLGPALHLFKHFPDLPESLQQELLKREADDAVRLEAVRNLVPDLLPLVQARNDGSHTFTVRGKRAAGWREQLLEKGLLREFFRATVLVASQQGPLNRGDGPTIA